MDTVDALMITLILVSEQQRAADEPLQIVDMTTGTKRDEPPFETLRPTTLHVFGFEPIGGHGGMVLYDLAFFNSLVRQGLEVTWVTCDETRVEPEGFQRWTPFRGIYEGPSWRRGIRYIRGLYALLQRANQLAKRQRVIIHQQFVTLPIAELAFVNLARWQGIPCVLTVHDVTPYVGVAAARMRRLLPRLYGQYDALIVHSKAAQAELKDLVDQPAPPIYVIPHGHYNDSHGDGPNLPQSEARARLGVSNSARVILFLGGIRREKGLEYLLRALPDVLRLLPDTVLIVAGRPYQHEASSYENLIDALNVRNHVRLRWEFVPDDELPTYYRAADVATVPYTKAYQSGVCLTAYAFRRPVVASAIGGLQEQVIDGKTGYLVPPANPSAIAQALISILSRPGQAEIMGQLGHDWAADVCGWEKIAVQTIQIYDQTWRSRRHTGGDN